MKDKFIFYIQSLFILLATQLHGQSAPYILGEYPMVFSNIESLGFQAEMDAFTCAHIVEQSFPRRVVWNSVFFRERADKASLYAR